MTTITIATIMARIVTVIEGLTAATVPLNNVNFRENRAPSPHLRQWLPDAGGNRVFRLFDVLPVGDRITPGVMNPGATFVEQAVRVTVAYPAIPTLYGHDQLRDLLDVISADALQIQNALKRPGGLAGAGHEALRLDPGVKHLDAGDRAIWFQDIDMKAQFYSAR